LIAASTALSKRSQPSGRNSNLRLFERLFLFDHSRILSSEGFFFMNTKPSKPPKRWKHYVDRDRPIDESHSGNFQLGLSDQNFALLVAAIATGWPYVEERMMKVLRELLHAGPMDLPLRPIYRSIVNAQIRIRIMKSLLEDSPINMSKSPRYDEIINEFSSLNTIRNKFIHGLWSVHEDGRVFLAEPSVDDLWFLDSRPVKIGELQSAIQRMNQLSRRIGEVTTRDLVARLQAQQQSSPQTPPQPPDDSAG
jgi:hypothetical protein